MYITGVMDDNTYGPDTPVTTLKQSEIIFEVCLVVQKLWAIEVHVKIHARNVTITLFTYKINCNTITMNCFPLQDRHLERKVLGVKKYLNKHIQFVGKKELY